MDKIDRILVAIYRNVGKREHPEDFPVEAEAVSEATSLGLLDLMATCLTLMDCNLIEVAKRRDQPVVLYLTKYGASRARLLAAAEGPVTCRPLG